MFIEYGKTDDFVGMDMARKFLQMGFTRARRYANHKSGRKYSSFGTALPREEDWKDSKKPSLQRLFLSTAQKQKVAQPILS